jgi:hypothetical protein
MKFGGLSEEDVKKIEEILSREGIAFEISKDNEIEELNASSLHNNLRHFVPPNLSLHVLAISIEDNDFQRLSALGKKELLGLGITDEAPLAEDFTPYTGHPIQETLARDPQKMIAFNLKHQLIAGIILLIIIALVKYL